MALAALYLSPVAPGSACDLSWNSYESLPGEALAPMAVDAAGDPDLYNLGVPRVLIMGDDLSQEPVQSHTAPEGRARRTQVLWQWLLDHLAHEYPRDPAWKPQAPEGSVCLLSISSGPSSGLSPSHALSSVGPWAAAQSESSSRDEERSLTGGR